MPISEYNVYEIRNGKTEIDEQPGESMHTSHIGTVEAAGLSAAYDRALSQFGSPIAVE